MALKYVKKMCRIFKFSPAVEFIREGYKGF